MITYEKCTEILQVSRYYRPIRMIGNNTYLRKDNDDFIIKFHNTDIVKISPDNTFEIDVDNFFTLTTKQRLNEYAPVRIVQRNHRWIINGYGEFFNGIRIKNGKVLNPKPIEEKEKIDVKTKELQKKIKQYVNDFCKDIIENGIEFPSGGDCWFCHFTQMKTEIPWGDCTGNMEHLFNHFDEKYFVPSLLWNAIRERKYVEPQLIFALIKESPERYISMAKQALRHYFQKRLQQLLDQMN